MRETAPRFTIEPAFVGREDELRWLDERILHTRRSHEPILLMGVPGVGKTALLRQFFASRDIPSTQFWLDLSSEVNPQNAVNKLVGEFYNEISERRDSRLLSDVVVTFDGTEALTDDEINSASARLFNIKAIRSLIFVDRRIRSIKRSQSLILNELSPLAASQLFEASSFGELPPELVAQGLNAAHGNPLAIAVLANIIKAHGVEAVADLIYGRLYQLEKTVAVPEPELIQIAAPKIISVTEDLINQLKRQPESMHGLSSRRFEEVLAELLSGLGFEVELTQATRDGGKDILAYLNTEAGRLLCLVEAKKFRTDRKVGVGLVRTLYGTLCDYQANSAMLVTTSSFSPDAHAGSVYTNVDCLICRL